VRQGGFSGLVLLAWPPSPASSLLTPESCSPSLSRREASCQSHGRSGWASVQWGEFTGSWVFGGVSAGRGDSASRRSPGLAYWAPHPECRQLPQDWWGGGRRAWDRATAAWKTLGGEKKGP